MKLRAPVELLIWKRPESAPPLIEQGPARQVLGAVSLPTLHITSLDFLAKLSPAKIWVKPSGEQSFVYGNHVVKAHVRRVTDETPVNGGVIILSEQGEIPLGFGTAARSVGDIRNGGPEAIVVYHQADTGEYLRDEAELF